jgi:hypothetical protein
LKWVQLRQSKCCRRFLIVCFVPIRFIALFVIYLLCIDSISLWNFTLKLETLNWWKPKSKEFVTNCSAVNAAITWVIWICVEFIYYFTLIMFYLLIIAFIVALLWSICTGKMQTFYKYSKELYTVVSTSPRFFWALFVSYILGTPFRPPVDTSSQANRALGDKYLREETTKSFMTAHKTRASEINHRSRCPYCKVFFQPTDIIVFLNCSKCHIYHENCLNSHI